MTNLTRSNRVIEYIQVLIEFLTVSIHYILYIRGIYSSDSFENKSVFGINVKVSRHPKVQEYISEFIKSTQKDLINGNLQLLHLVILVNQLPRETFTFKLESLVGELGFDAALENVEVDLDGLRNKLIPFLRKINTMDCLLRDLPRESEPSFCFLIQTMDEPMDKEGSWIPSTENTKQNHAMEQSSVLIPIRTAQLGLLKMEMYCQEN